jgi:hypothetical protein
MSLTGKGRDRDRFRVYSNPNLVRLVKLSHRLPLFLACFPFSI